jgi:twitching motility protein PilI
LIGETVSSEIFNDYKIFPMPNCVEWLVGLTNIRGNLIPVYDLVRLLGLDVEEMEYKHLLVIDRGVNSIAVLIDSLPSQLDVISWKPVAHKARLNRNISEYIKTTYSYDGIVWMDIDHNEFFRSIKEDIAL